MEMSPPDMLPDHEVHLGTRIPEAPVAVKSDKLPQILAAVTANMVIISAGTLLTWSSPATTLLQKEDGPFVITDQQASWVGSLLALGAMFGSLPSGILITKMGRKNAILSLALPVTLSWVLIVVTNSVVWLYVARFVAGLTLGGVSFTIPIYVAEVVEPSVRGPLASLLQVGFNLGILYAYAVGALGSYGLLNFTCLALPILFLVLFVWMPDTPQYLLSKNDRAGAAKALQWFRGKRCNVDEELQQLKEAAEENAKDKSSLKDLLSPLAVKALVIPMGLVGAQQMGGICVLLFYTDSIFKAAGSTMSASVSSVVVGVVMLIMSICTMPLVDRAGRRILLLVSSFIEMLSLLVLGVYFLLKEQMQKDVDGISWLPLACLIIYIIVYCIGLGPLPWVVMAEVLPPKVKGNAGGIVATFCWITSFIITNTFQTFIDYAGRYIAFWFFAVNCALATVFIYFKVPETKGLTLQEIQTRLAGNRTNATNGSL
ncbi:facilitated trehalose transporter Tret1-like [Periplaneta americana]|uniref:facilitated trehalose transporter Tret1-like n=1 Tax=Periplaneta americana TaxID=6978 RepID=UPI0037E9277D